MALMDTHIMNGLLAVINGLYIFVGQLLLVVDEYVRLLCTTGFVGFGCFVLTNDEADIFYIAVNHIITKKIQFFSSQSVVFCLFLHCIYRSMSFVNTHGVPNS